MDHRRGPADKISEVVGEIRIEAGQDRVVGKVGVRPKHHFAHDEIAQGVDTEHRRVILIAGDVAKRLRHLGAAHQPPAVRDDALRWRQARGHQERRPVQRVLPHDLFTDQVRGDRPEPLHGPLMPWSEPNPSTVR